MRRERLEKVSERWVGKVSIADLVCLEHTVEAAKKLHVQLAVDASTSSR